MSEVHRPPHDRRWEDADWRQAVSRQLLPWYRRHARTLPWRETSDPYHIWVSEVMLQQTQVATVIPYYARFLKAFPTIAKLAAAPQSEVLRYWEGLGYYRRARQLHAAAIKITDDHEGKFPKDFADVRELPGIGRYTAGAVLSFAFGQRLPILEANTLRLFSRLIALRAPLAQSNVQKLLWEVAEAVLPKRNVGRFNQAIMELGSLVCTPREPNCSACPLAKHCAAHQQGLEREIPGAVKQVRYEEVVEHALAVHDRHGRWWLRQRPSDERWEGLWDFPRFGTNSPLDAGSASEAMGFEVWLHEQLTTLLHGVTRFKITLHLYRAEVTGRAKRSRDNAGWFTPTEIKNLPLTMPARRLCQSLPGCEATPRT